MRKTSRGMIAALMLAGASTAAQGQEIMDFSALVGDVDSSNPGPEMIVPFMVEGTDDIKFSFRIFKPDTPATNNATLLYSTPAKPIKFPPIPCENPSWHERDEAWKFLRFGTYVVAGVALEVECWDSVTSEHKEAYRSTVYIVDASAPTNTPALLNYGAELIGLNLTDNLNGGGSSQDLMISVLNEATGGLRVDVRDFASGKTYSINTVKIAK